MGAHGVSQSGYVGVNRLWEFECWLQLSSTHTQLTAQNCAHNCAHNSKPLSGSGLIQFPAHNCARNCAAVRFNSLLNPAPLTQSASSANHPVALHLPSDTIPTSHFGYSTFEQCLRVTFLCFAPPIAHFVKTWVHAARARKGWCGFQEASASFLVPAQEHLCFPILVTAHLCVVYQYSSDISQAGQKY